MTQMQSIPLLEPCLPPPKGIQWVQSLQLITLDTISVSLAKRQCQLLLSVENPCHFYTIHPQTQIQPTYLDHRVIEVVLFWEKKAVLTMKGNGIEEAYQMLKKHLPHKGFGDYFKPLRRLGKGAFATVYLVEHKHTNQLLAAKVFSKEGQKLEVKGTEALLNQIELLRQLSHPNILQFEGVFQTDNLIYVVTEHLDGGTLEDAMRHKHLLTGPIIRQILADCLAALLYLKQQGIVHRDLKPTNILKRQSDQHWVIADFGLAAKIQNNPLFINCGTPGYIAPELPTQSMINSSSDLYSFGVVAFELMLGKLPFKVETEGVFEKKLIWEGLEGGQYKELPREAAKFLEGLLEKEPSKRLSAETALQSIFLKKKSEQERWDAFSFERKQSRMQKILKMANVN